MGCNAKQRAECNSGRIGRFGRYIVLFFVKMALVQTCSPSQALTRQIPPFVAARHLPPERGKSFLKGRALGNPRKLHLFAKASPFGRGGFAKQRRRGRGCLPENEPSQSRYRSPAPSKGELAATIGSRLRGLASPGKLRGFFPTKKRPALPVEMRGAAWFY